MDDEPLVRRGLRAVLAAEPDVAVIGECGDGREAVRRIRAERPDLVFLDVQMPELDGLGVVDALAADERPPALVFVTAYDAYALRAFEVHAVDYLLKPFDEARLRTALARARQRLGATRVPADGARLAALLAELRPAAAAPERGVAHRPDRALERFLVRTGDRLLPVAVTAVDWIEAADNYVRLHVGAERHALRETIKALEAQLDARRFARIHRSTIVNLDRVRELRPLPSGDCAVLLHDGTRLTLSRSFRAAFEARFGRAR
ncbi:MAG TPA: LytTR family DNA-binding domain-containing protein [Gemmatimonadales bacterium]|nr:LytTR family DNA-binding domain-containing protein [Gemmatimonadales bacterium]